MESAIGYSDGIKVDTSLEQITISLYRGSNLISIPITPKSTDLSTALLSIKGLYASVYAYVASTASWTRHIPGATDNTLSTIGAGKAYCIDMLENADLIITGNKLTDTTIQLVKGLNLVGYNSGRQQSLQEALSTISGKYNYIHTYDNGTKKWSKDVPGSLSFLSNLTQLKPYTGFWIDAKEATSWKINP